MAGGIPAYLMCVLNHQDFIFLPTRHWASGVAPWVIAAGIMGGADYIRQAPQRFSKLAIILLFCLLVGSYSTGWDHFRPVTLWNIVPVGEHLRRANEEVLARLRPDDKISADSLSFTYLFRRGNVTLFPNAYREADVVIVRRPKYAGHKKPYWGYETLAGDSNFELVLLEDSLWEDIALFRRVYER